jgi:hypothetical protein
MAFFSFSPPPPPTLVSKEGTYYYSPISSDLEPNESEKKKTALSRAHLFVSFIQAFVLGFCQCMTPSFSLFFFFSAALVCAQLIHRRARAFAGSHFFFFLFFIVLFSASDGSVGRVGW